MTTGGPDDRVVLARWEFNLIRINALALIIAIAVAMALLWRATTVLDRALRFAALFVLVDIALLPLISEVSRSHYGRTLRLRDGAVMIVVNAGLVTLIICALGLVHW